MNIDNDIKQPRKRGTVPTVVRKAIERYSAVYLQVYGCAIKDWTYDNRTGFIRLGGLYGVSYARLNTMTRQLKFRAGI